MTNCSDGEAFWAYSLRIYGAPGASEAYLALQDAVGADVNILLFILWRADAGVVLALEDVQRLEELVRTWREQVVQPLRSVRRRLKTLDAAVPHVAAQELRAKIGKLELEGEKLQQFAMARHAAQIGGTIGVLPETAARAGLAAYGELLGVELPHQHVATLLDVFCSAAPDAF